MIFYFTGTGNSLFVAQEIAKELGDTEVLSMAENRPLNQIGGKTEKIGFVFPSYYGNLPRIVRSFISELNIDPATYLWAVVTMGGAGQGSITTLEKALADKGLALRYGRGILMPANYIIKYNPMFIKRTEKSGKRIQRIANEIKSEKVLLKKGRLSSNNLYDNIAELDKDFFVESGCSGCGLCQRICPVSNIKLTDNRPEWLGHCEHCMACIHRCPLKVIQYGTKTKKRRRYYNSHVE
jgi:MinD superfamily P-loop ATPase